MLGNQGKHVTKEMYFSMCEALGSEPIESEIPVELDDLPILVQQALQIYSSIQDEWEYFAGSYVGKRFGTLPLIYQLFEIPKEEQLVVYKILLLIDEVRKELIKEEKPST